MIAAVSSDGDRFGGLRAPYKRNYSNSPLLEGFAFAHPGRPTPPDVNAVAVPAIQASVSTDRKKTNAQIVYTRITPLDSHLVAGKAEGCVFVSRSQMMHTNTGPEKRSLVAGLEAVNLRLAEHVPDSQLAVAYNPLDQWRRLPELREWPLDGVLLGLDNEVNASQTLNVCVAGPCPVRNVFREDIVMPLDYCYLMLVAELRHKGKPDAHWHFQYVPCTSRTLAEPTERGQRMLARVPALTEEQRWHAVGGWRLGRVMDGKAVNKIDQKTLTLDVRVEWAGWRALRLEYPDSQIGGVPRKRGLLAQAGAPLPVNTCLTFHWPTAMPDKRDDPIEAPSKPPMNDLELGLKGGMTKNKHAIADEKRRGCVPSRRPALAQVLRRTRPFPMPFVPTLEGVAEGEDEDGEDEEFQDPSEPKVPRPRRTLKLRTIDELDETPLAETPLPDIEDPLKHVACMLALWFELEREREKSGATFDTPEPIPGIDLPFRTALQTDDAKEAGVDVDVADPADSDVIKIICSCATAVAVRFLERLAAMTVYDAVCKWLTDENSANDNIARPWWYDVVERDLKKFYGAYAPLLRRMVRDAPNEECELGCEYDLAPAPEPAPEPPPAAAPEPPPKKRKLLVPVDDAELLAPPSPVSSVYESDLLAVEQEAAEILSELEQQPANTDALDAPAPGPNNVKDWMRALKRRSTAWALAHSDVIEKLLVSRQANSEDFEKTRELLELRERLLLFFGRAEGDPAAELFAGE